MNKDPKIKIRTGDKIARAIQASKTWEILRNFSEKFSIALHSPEKPLILIHLVLITRRKQFFLFTAVEGAVTSHKALKDSSFFMPSDIP